MGQKIYEIDENDLLNMNINSLDNIDSEIVSKSSFQYINIVGRGGFGKVWKVLHKKSKKLYAMKEMSKVKILDKKSETSVKNERTLLSKMFHSFIVNMHYSFQDTDNLYLIVDFLSGGDLRYQYCLDKEFNEEQTKFLICCILLSLEYLHSNNILHRDIKPENLVFDGNGYLKLTDFGIAKIYNKNIDNSKENSGTLGYIAPEVLFHLKHDYRCDYYAVGIVGYELMLNQRPYDFINRKEAREQILAKEAKITKYKLKDGWSKDFMDFINQLIKRKPEDRLGKNGIDEIKKHPWLKYFNWKDLYLMKIKAPFIPPETDNFDSKYCNMEEILSEEEQIKYKNIMNSIRYKFIFEDYKYYNRQKDNLINNVINKEMNISKNINSLIKNIKGKKPIIKRNQNGLLYKATWKKYTMDNLNNMISQYKSMELVDNKNKNNDNKNKYYFDENDENEKDNIISNDMKTCINPHLVYRALEQKEIECLSNDEEDEKNKSKNIKKYIYKSLSPVSRNNNKIENNKKIIVERNNNKNLKSYKSIPVNNIKNNNIKENNFVNNKLNYYNENENQKNENVNKKIKKTNYAKPIINEKNNIKIKNINKIFKSDKLEYDIDKIKSNNLINFIKINKNINLLSNKINNE